jgi:hypothetical protein
MVFLVLRTKVASRRLYRNNIPFDCHINIDYSFLQDIKGGRSLIDSLHYLGKFRVGFEFRHLAIEYLNITTRLHRLTQDIYLFLLC